MMSADCGVWRGWAARACTARETCLRYRMDALCAASSSRASRKGRGAAPGPALAACALARRVKGPA